MTCTRLTSLLAITLVASLITSPAADAQIRIGNGGIQLGGSKSGGSGIRIGGSKSGGSNSSGPSFQIGGSKSGGSNSSGPSFQIGGGSKSNGSGIRIGGSKSGDSGIDLGRVVGEIAQPLLGGGGGSKTGPITDHRWRGPKEGDKSFGRIIIGGGSTQLAIDPAMFVGQPSWTSPIRPGKPIVCPTPGPDPIVQPVVPVDPHPIAPAPPAPPADPALRMTLEAQAAFAAMDYDLALELMDRVLQLTPESGTAYQFRGLIHFSQGDYDEAASDVYETLLRGPIWTWDTIHPLYENHRLYTNHYRFLYKAANEDNKSVSKHFLLAYHHLVLGHLQHGEQELRKVLAILPSDPVAKQLLNVVVQTQTNQGNTTAKS